MLILHYPVFVCENFPTALEKGELQMARIKRRFSEMFFVIKVYLLGLNGSLNQDLETILVVGDESWTVLKVNILVKFIQKKFSFIMYPFHGLIRPTR
jgi:hypothetical protein